LAESSILEFVFSNADCQLLPTDSNFPIFEANYFCGWVNYFYPTSDAAVFYNRSDKSHTSWRAEIPFGKKMEKVSSFL